MFKITGQEFEVLRSKISTAKFSKTRTRPTAFTEKGLYMLSTILKSKQAVEATFGIIETFAKIRALTRTIKSLSIAKNENEKRGLMQRSGELIAEVLDKRWPEVLCLTPKSALAIYPPEEEAGGKKNTHQVNFV